MATKTTDTPDLDLPDAVDPATLPRECEHCGEELEPGSGRGRPRRFCDRKCRRAARKERQAAEAAAAGDEPQVAAAKPAKARKPKAKKPAPADDDVDSDDDVI